MAKEANSSVSRSGKLQQPQPHPRLSKLRERAMNQSHGTTGTPYQVAVKHLQAACLTDSLPDLLETSSSCVSSSTSPSTASSGCASFSSSTSTSSSSSSCSSSNRSHVLSEPISSFLGSSKQHLHIYEDIDVRGPIRMTPLSGVMFQQNKGLIKPLAFRVTSPPSHCGVGNISGSKSNNFAPATSKPMNNLNVHQQHEGTRQESASLMCNRMTTGDLQHQVSERICLSPFHSAVHEASAIRTVDLPHHVMSTMSTSRCKGGPLLTTTNDLLAPDHVPHEPVEGAVMHRSPLTFAMTSPSSSSGIGDSSSSSGHSFTTNSQCSLSQSSYQLDDESSAWYSPGSFESHQPPIIHSPQGALSVIHPLQRQDKSRHNINSTGNGSTKNTGILSNNNHNNANGDNPISLPPKQRLSRFNMPQQRVNPVERSSTFNSDDLTMQSTPSPCSDNDTVHSIKLSELESLVREKDAQISYLRETLEQNEQVIFKVYEEKEQSWHKEYKKLRTQFESSLMLYQQKALKAESNLALAAKQAEDDKIGLLATIAKHKERNALLETKLAELSGQVESRSSGAGVRGPLTAMQDDKQFAAQRDEKEERKGDHENGKSECTSDDGHVSQKDASKALPITKPKGQMSGEHDNKMQDNNNALSNNKNNHLAPGASSGKLIDRQVQQVKPFPPSLTSARDARAEATSSSSLSSSSSSSSRSSSCQPVPSTAVHASASLSAARQAATVPSVCSATSRKSLRCTESTSDSNDLAQEWHNLTSRHEFCSATHVTSKPTPATTAGAKSDFNSPVSTSFATSCISPSPGGEEADAHQILEYNNLKEQMDNMHLLQEQVTQLLDKLKSSEIQLSELIIENSDLKLLQARLTTQLDLIQQSFNAERSVWKDEKDKVIQYQKQLNRNFLVILQRNKELELQIKSLKQSSNISNISNTIYQITTGETTC